MCRAPIVGHPFPSHPVSLAEHMSDIAVVTQNPASPAQPNPAASSVTVDLDARVVTIGGVAHILKFSSPRTGNWLHYPPLRVFVNGAEVMVLETAPHARVPPARSIGISDIAVFSKQRSMEWTTVFEGLKPNPETRCLPWIPGTFQSSSARVTMHLGALTPECVSPGAVLTHNNMAVPDGVEEVDVSVRVRGNLPSWSFTPPVKDVVVTFKPVV